jgi:N-formylglutamate amidohydrolase
MIKKSWIPNANVICFPWSRSIWDPNREIKIEKEDSKLDIWKKFIRDYDFNWQKIIDNPGQFREIWIKKAKKYHIDLNSKLKKVEKYLWWSIWIDIHDTGNNLMNINSDLDQFRKDWFPEITLWTKNWESCNTEILEYLANKLNYYLWLKVLINEPYEGWYVTTKHWKEHREKINNWNWSEKSKRNMIQIELWRYLYMQESTQKINWERMEIIWEWIKRAITDTWIQFWKEYFKLIK